MAMPMTERQKYLAAMMRGQISPISGPGMNSALMNEGDRALQAQQEGRQSAAPPTVSPGAPGPQRAMQDPRLTADVEGGERGVDRQRAVADAMRGKTSLEGRTVGPLNVYQGPNWGEVLANVGENIGAGMLERSANKRAAEVSKDRIGRAAAEAGIADEAELTRLAERAEDIDIEERSNREYAEWNVPGREGTVNGYVQDGIPVDQDGKPLPEGATQVAKVTRGSGSQFIPKVEEDAFGNSISRKFDKGTGQWGDPTFIDNTPYTPEEGKRRGELRAKQGGDEARAIETAKDDVEAITGLDKEIKSFRNADRLYSQVQEALDAGAESGPITRFLPTLTNATTELNNARDRMALEKIGQFTFGSLSEAEGEWLKQTSIPNLDEPELRKWVAKRVEGNQRMMQAARFEREWRRAGYPTDDEFEDQVNDIIYGGGFTYSD